MVIINETPEMLFRQRMIELAELATRLGLSGTAATIRGGLLRPSALASRGTRKTANSFRRHKTWVAGPIAGWRINPFRTAALLLDSAADEIEALLHAKREPSPLTKLARQNPPLVVSPQIRARAEREFEQRVKPYRDGQRAGRRNMR